MRDRRLLAVLVAGAVLWAAALVFLLGTQHHGMIDLRVYRTGGQAWLQGLPLYDKAFPAPLDGPPLPFTYPPLAAVLFAGLTVLPWWVAVALVIVTGIAGLAVACWVAADRLMAMRVPSVRSVPSVQGGGPAASGDQDARTVWDRGRGRVALVSAAAVGAAPLIEPVRETISFGQVNLLLVGAIAADCLLRRTPWPRGALIGLTAAIKLTPAAFVLFFVARRQWRPVLVAAATFVAAGVLGLLFAPGDTRAYWFGALLDPSRIGGLEFASNQSLRGLLHRLGLTDGLETATWLGLSALVGMLALLAVAHLRRGTGDGTIHGNSDRTSDGTSRGTGDGTGGRNGDGTGGRNGDGTGGRNGDGTGGRNGDGTGGRNGDGTGDGAGDDVAALLVTAAAALLVSPVSWSHHWVWAVLGLLWLADRAARAGSGARTSLALFAGTLAVFAAAPFWWLSYRNERELHWTFGQQLLGNAYIWVGIAVVAAGAVAALRARRSRLSENAPGYPGGKIGVRA